ncbi:uncharacterized protein LOC135835243 [Planococcus citri]|uniref:uncharacterized protein LOC135835243 n=1 Tax=Planococcus citri TaxID=170843 RepID=UPI0031FA26B8
MAETTSEVCDIFQTNPPTLRELAAIAINLQIWRDELQRLRTSDTWEQFDPHEHVKNILLETHLPDLQSGIYRMLKKYVKVFGYSLRWWAKTHHGRIFRFFCNHQSYLDVLERFDDFICDFDGRIHEDWTAKRMMQCPRFDVSERFSIACMHFFEDDIKELWPLVSENEQSYNVTFNDSPQLCYWIYRLRNTLDMIQNSRNDSVDEIMIQKCIIHRAAVKYFWNRMPLENRVRTAITQCDYEDIDEYFMNFILPKLYDQQLAQVVREEGSKIMHSMLRDGHRYKEEFVLRAWMHIKNVMSERDFANLVAKMLLTQGICKKLDYEFERDPDSLVYLCREIWNSAPNDLKRSSTRVILSDSRLFKKRCSIIHDFQLYSNDFEFLFTILSDASFKERSSFWHNCWHNLILEFRSKHLQQMMKLCFKYDREIIQFKEEVIATNAKVHQFCVSLLHCSHFGKLNKFIDFLWSDIQAARNFKQQILLLAFFTKDCYFNRIIVRNPKYFNEFVNDAYNNVDLSNDFKNQLMLSPSVQSCLSNYARSFCCLDEIMDFIDTLVLREETLVQIKMSMIDSLKGRLSSVEMSPRDLRLLEQSNQFLLWCLGSEEEVTKFKLNLNP